MTLIPLSVIMLLNVICGLPFLFWMASLPLLPKVFFENPVHWCTHTVHDNDEDEVDNTMLPCTHDGDGGNSAGEKRALM